MFTQIKRNIYIIKEILFHWSQYKKLSWSSLLAIQRIESLNTKFSYRLATFLYKRFESQYKKNSQLEVSDIETSKIISTFDDKYRFIEHNILVLKPYISSAEKGVLLIKYSEIINAIPALFDLNKLSTRFNFVFIPSTESPLNPFNFIYRRIYPKSIVLSHFHSLRENNTFKNAGLETVDLCAGDWINNNKFQPKKTIEKKFDFCVIANFIPFKNYDFLIDTLKLWPKNTPLSFAVVASSYGSLGKQWFIDLLQSNGLENNCTIYSDISSSEVNKVLGLSYCHVLCSWREGANKASFEAMLTGVPAIVPQNHIGFPVHKFDKPHVLKYKTSQELLKRITEAKVTEIKNIPQLGYSYATKKLNERLKEISKSKGLEWTRNIVETSVTAHLHYINSEDINQFYTEYEFIESCKTNVQVPYKADIAKKVTILNYD
jgi:glycosyltransferase involved in cell wall biosynthesis